MNRKFVICGLILLAIYYTAGMFTPFEYGVLSLLFLIVNILLDILGRLKEKQDIDKKPRRVKRRKTSCRRIMR